jgi:hypothetical protein
MGGVGTAAGLKLGLHSFAVAERPLDFDGALSELFGFAAPAAAGALSVLLAVGIFFAILLISGKWSVAELNFTF